MSDDKQSTEVTEVQDGQFTALIKVTDENGDVHEEEVVVHSIQHLIERVRRT